MLQFLKKHEKLITILFVAALSVIPVSLAFNNSVWLDEAYGLWWSRMPFGEMMRRMIGDVHPPLYYLMLRLVLMLTGHSLLAAKLLSVLPLILILVLGATFVRKQFGRKAMIFFDLFILFSPMMLKKSVEVRMYTWAFYFVLLAAVQMFYLLRADAQRKNWVLFTVFSLMAAYTHYFALVSMFFLYAALLLFFLFTRSLKKTGEWGICAAATVIGYLPWLPSAIHQVTMGGASWITMPTSRLGLIRDLFRTSIPMSEHVYLVLLIAVFLAALFLLWKKRDAEIYWALSCMSVIWFVLIFGLVYGTLGYPILIPRYLMIPLCLTILGMSAMCRYVNKWLLIFPCALFLATGLSVYPKVWREEYVTLTDETLKFVDEHIGENAIVISDASSLDTVIPYYFPDRLEERPDIYIGDYKEMWYLDVYHSVDTKKLEEAGIQFINYGQYGFDNVDFEIYYLYQAP